MANELYSDFIIQEILYKTEELQRIKQKAYYYFYDLLSKWHWKYNPCDFRKNKCVRNRIYNESNGCCNNGSDNHCQYNTVVGCSIKSLGCKLFICDDAWKLLSDDARKEFQEIEIMIKKSKLSIEKRNEVL